MELLLIVLFIIVFRIETESKIFYYQVQKNIPNRRKNIERFVKEVK